MLTLHFDYPSPAAAVAVLRLQQLADAGSAIRFSGLDVLGLQTAIPPTLDQLHQIERYHDAAARLGLRLQRPSRRPSTLGAHLLGELAERRGVGSAWRQRCLRAYWEGDADLGDGTVLTELAGEVGLDVGDVAERLADGRARTAARQHAIEQRRRGVGDVPVLEVDGTLIGAELPDADLRTLASL